MKRGTILRSTKVVDGQGVLFAPPAGKITSNVTMFRLVERRGLAFRTLGFRPMFRTWVEEQTDTPFEVAEAALGHVVDSSVVREYQRSDRLEKRWQLMVAKEVYLIEFEMQHSLG
jgi:integrase